MLVSSDFIHWFGFFPQELSYSASGGRAIVKNA